MKDFQLQLLTPIMIVIFMELIVLLLVQVSLIDKNTKSYIDTMNLIRSNAYDKKRNSNFLSINI